MTLNIPQDIATPRSGRHEGSVFGTDNGGQVELSSSKSLETINIALYK